MTERIRALAEMTLAGKMHVSPVKTEFDRMDLFLPEEEKNVKRLCEYIRNQEPFIGEYSTMTGTFAFDGSVVGDAFNRSGHKHTAELISAFYLKPIERLSVNEWQHATADYTRVLNVGIAGIMKDIEASMGVHSAPEEQAFLRGLYRVAEALLDWEDKCARAARVQAEKAESAQRRADMLRLSDVLARVPRHAPETFFEAVLCIYFCFSAADDSVGTLDRYLTPFYERDIARGILTRDQAMEMVQELLLMLQAKTPRSSGNFTRGGQSHFCVGGYLSDGTDGFNEVSRLIVDGLMELPTYIPEITFRWTRKTPREVFAYMLDCERHDKNKRIAFTNDEKRIRCFVDMCHIPFERAVGYTMVGCNEPAFVGSIIGSNSKGNVLLCVDRLFHDKADELRAMTSFDMFYARLEAELLSDIDKIYAYDDAYNSLRARDINYITCLFFNGCIERARSLTQGGADAAVSSPMLMGLTNLIDSAIVIAQFVFEEKRFTMDEMIAAVQDNWAGHEDMLTIIKKQGRFFGNDDALSNAVAQRIYKSLYEHIKDKTNLFGYHFVVADSVGYNEHHRWFGEMTRATPDGRRSGECVKYGISQSGGYDRNGLTALLNSVASLDPNAVACGSTVTNIRLDERLIRDDNQFEKLVVLLETYFKMGGVQFQLNYVSSDELRAAQQSPEDYPGLRVRVTGFSDYFANLKRSMQDEIIDRTVQNG